MQITFSFRNLEPSDAVRQYATDKIQKLQKFLRSPLTADVTVHLERHLHVIDISVTADGERFAGHEESDDMYASIDLCLDKIDRQVRDTKATLTGRKRHPH